MPRRTIVLAVMLYERSPLIVCPFSLLFIFSWLVTFLDWFLVLVNDLGHTSESPGSRTRPPACH
jgi:hypothetical protein